LLPELYAPVEPGVLLVPEEPVVPVLLACPPRDVLLLPMPVEPLVLDGEPPAVPCVAPDACSRFEFFSDAEVLLDEPAWPAPLVALVLPVDVPPVPWLDMPCAIAVPEAARAAIMTAIIHFFIVASDFSEGRGPCCVLRLYVACIWNVDAGHV
jgi:hypothetical protein